MKIKVKNNVDQILKKNQRIPAVSRVTWHINFSRSPFRIQTRSQRRHESSGTPSSSSDKGSATVISMSHWWWEHTRLIEVQTPVLKLKVGVTRCVRTRRSTRSWPILFLLLASEWIQPSIDQLCSHAEAEQGRNTTLGLATWAQTRVWRMSWSRHEYQISWCAGNGHPLKMMFTIGWWLTAVHLIHSILYMENCLFPGKNVPGYREIYFPITRKYFLLDDRSFQCCLQGKTFQVTGKFVFL